MSNRLPVTPPALPAAYAEFQALLDRAAEVATILAERATEIDLAGTPPLGNMRLLARAGLLGLSAPESVGGAGAPGIVARRVIETLAAGCGTTAFVATQHIGVASQLAASPNTKLCDEMLPRVASGSRFFGVAFSHVRRPGAPLLRVTPKDDAFCFDGEAPWFTGWGIMDEAMLAGVLPDGKLCFVIVPLAESAGITASPPLALAAASSSSTVTLKVDQVSVGLGRHLKTITAEEFAAGDLQSIVRPSAQSLGVLRAAVRIMREQAAARPNPATQRAASALEREGDTIRNYADAWEGHADLPGYVEAAHQIRTWAIEASIRAAHGAVTATGGSANGVRNPAQRLLREALLFSVIAQTAEVRRTGLERLAARAEHAVQRPGIALPGGGECQ